MADIPHSDHKWLPTTNKNNSIKIKQPLPSSTKVDQSNYWPLNSAQCLDEDPGLYGFSKGQNGREPLNFR